MQIKITKEKFDKYVKLQESGKTNMCAVNVVSSYTGLTKDEIYDIMENYGKYELEFKEDN